MIEILRKPGWQLNPKDKVVNSILKRIEANDGHCPCHNTGYDTKCPCSDYRENDICHCTLYVKNNIGNFKLKSPVPLTIREVAIQIPSPHETEFCMKTM